MVDDDQKHRQFMGHAPWVLETARESVGPGWHQLLPSVFEAAEAGGVSIDQVKEKMGLLRVYAGRHSANKGSPAWEVVDRVIHEAVNQSAVTCEVCGEPGRTYHWDSEPPTEEDHWWIKTLCHRHAVEYYEERRGMGELFEEHRDPSSEKGDAT